MEASQCSWTSNQRTTNAMELIDRRDVLTVVAGMLGALVYPRLTSTQAAKTRLILLGTGGGPRPRTASSASAQVILVNDEAYVVDCGNGVARQLVFAGVPLTRLRHIFLTHHHSDHNADYGNLISLACSTSWRRCNGSVTTSIASAAIPISSPSSDSRAVDERSRR